MSDDTATANAPEVQDSFTSLGDIRVAHLSLMREASESEAGDPVQKFAPADTLEALRPSAADIRSFLDKAKLAGRAIDRESDRRAAQRIIDYWLAELVARPAITKMDMSPARLEPFVVQDVAVPGPQASGAEATRFGDHEADHVLSPDDEAERLRIRVAAQARQWANTQYDGYLLRGEALVQAMKLAPGNDIDAFINASAAAEGDSQKRSGWIRRRILGGFIGLSVVLAVATAFAVMQTREAQHAQSISLLAVLAAESNAKTATRAMQVAESALIETQKKRDENAALVQQLQSQVDATNAALADARQKQADAEREKANALDRYGQALAKTDEATKRFDEAVELSKTVDAALQLIDQALITGSIQLDDLTPQLRNLALVQIAGRVNSHDVALNGLDVALQRALAPLIGDVPESLPSDMPGYRPDFLGTVIPLPMLSAVNATDRLAVATDYVNYSLVMSKSQRMAFYAAVNLDRAQRLVLQTTGGKLSDDTRLGPRDQPDPRWYSATLLPVQLANSADIAWGSAFAGDPGTAALQLSLNANVLPNSVPQPSTLANGVWPQLENWVRNQHNPLANKVIIFTGPVFDPSPGVQTVPVPLGYWKVAVSAVSAAAKDQSLDAEFTVDAFFVPRDTTATEFDPSAFRVTIADLERRTGIDFGDLIEWTGSAQYPGADGRTAADILAGKVGQLDSPDINQRHAMMDTIALPLRTADLPMAELRKLVAALTNLAGTQNMLPLTAAGRINVLQALVWVPANLWRRPDWLPLWAQARVAAGDLELREDAGETTIGPQARGLLDQLEGQLGFGTSGQEVYFQFAGMTRQDAVQLTARLRVLGWAIPKPGEKRQASASGLNEVRYNPNSSADRAAADLLAADLTAAGQTAVAKPVAVIVAGTLEIWVSI